MGKNASPALRALIDNVNAAKAAGVFASTLSLAKEAKKDEKTVRRMLNGENEPALDTVSAIAKALHKEPWQLIQPLEVSGGPDGTPTLPKALEVVLNAMAKAPEKAELKQLLPMLVDTNAAAYRARLAELLAQPGAAPVPAVESKDFQPPVPPPIFDKTKQPS
ncbi:helix-turn-helix transcriptional regulator [Acidovorax sp.]|uniref:helix-turn-helix domain-containing protein n=1 Tax=Acidovorax sp. TaxID=1872122 RepID=UPI0031D1C451